MNINGSLLKRHKNWAAFSPVQSSFRGQHTGAVDRKWQSFPSQQCNGTCQRGRYTCITSITSSICERQQQVTDCNTVPRLLLQIEIIEVRADHPGGKETFRCLWIVPAFWWLERLVFRSQKYTLAIGPWSQTWESQSGSSGLEERRRMGTDATLFPHRLWSALAHSPPVGSPPSRCPWPHGSLGTTPPFSTRTRARWRRWRADPANVCGLGNAATWPGQMQSRTISDRSL